MLYTQDFVDKEIITAGNQDEAGMDYFGYKYGVEVFDLTTDQICSLLDNTDASKCKFTIWRPMPD